jgi:hypothetical protein
MDCRNWFIVGLPVFPRASISIGQNPQKKVTSIQIKIHEQRTVHGFERNKEWI